MNGLFLPPHPPTHPQPSTPTFNDLPMVIKCRFREKMEKGCCRNGCESVGVFRDAFLSGEQCFFRSISLKKRNRSIPRWTDQTKLSGPKKKRSQQQSFPSFVFCGNDDNLPWYTSTFLSYGKREKWRFCFCVLSHAGTYVQQKNHFYKIFIKTQLSFSEAF